MVGSSNGVSYEIIDARSNLGMCSSFGCDDKAFPFVAVFGIGDCIFSVLMIVMFVKRLYQVLLYSKIKETKLIKKKTVQSNMKNEIHFNFVLKLYFAFFSF